MDKPIPIANPNEVPTSSSGVIREGLYLMWMGAYGDVKVFVWADSFESAFEIMVEWADDNAPGVLTDIGEPELREAADALGIEWDDTWLTPYHDYNTADWIRVQEYAEIDLTPIGHTTLRNGQYIHSAEWGGDEVTDEETREDVLRESMEEAWGHDFLPGDRVRYPNHDPGTPSIYTVHRVNGDELTIVGENFDGDTFDYDVDASEVEHA